MRPFRFGIINEQMTSAQDWLERARKAEALGFSTFLIRDHFVADFFGNQFAPFSALAMASSATTSLRIGSLVIDNDFRHPAVLAKEVATLDLLSGGRFEFGLGAGWLQSEYDKSGLSFDGPGTRIERMEESISILKGLFSDGPVNFNGEHYRISELEGYPKPAQRPHPPLLIGGGGRRILTLAGREADIVHFLPRQINTGVIVSDPKDRLPGRIEEKIDWVRAGAGVRFDDIELGLGITISIENDRRGAAERLIRDGKWEGFTVENVWSMPSVFVGPIEQISEDMISRRERFGISYYVITSDEVDTFAPIVSRLAGT